MQPAVCRNQPLTQIVRRFRPAAGRFPRFSFETARICNLQPTPFPVQPPDVTTANLRVIPWEGLTYQGASRTISRMKSLPRDNARFSKPADWSMDAGNPVATAVGQTATPPRPARRSALRRANGKKPPKSVTTSAKRPSTAYTPKQREQLQRGLRILARMIVRAHLRQEASRVASALSAEPLTEPVPRPQSSSPSLRPRYSIPGPGRTTKLARM